jgi:hypothetical protein
MISPGYIFTNRLFRFHFHSSFNLNFQTEKKSFSISVCSMFTAGNSQSRQRKSVKRATPGPKIEDEEVVLPNLPQQSVATITSEFVKFLLFQRMQLPAPFDQLFTSVSETSETSGRKKRPNPRDHALKKIVVSLQSVFDLLQPLFAAQAPLEVLVAFGPTVMTAREVYSLRFAINPSSMSSSTSVPPASNQITRHFLRQLISCSASALSQMLPISNVHILLAFPKESALFDHASPSVESDPSSDSESPTSSLQQLFRSAFIPQPRFEYFSWNFYLIDISNLILTFLWFLSGLSSNIAKAFDIMFDSLSAMWILLFNYSDQQRRLHSNINHLLRLAFLPFQFPQPYLICIRILLPLTMPCFWSSHHPVFVLLMMR